MTAAPRPLPLPPLGLARAEAAEYVGVGVTLFDQMVDDGRMPQPRVINTRLVWDVDELRTHFKALPHARPGPTMPAPRFSA